MKSFSIVIPIYRLEYENNFEYFTLLIKSISKNCLNEDVRNRLNEIVIVNDQIEVDFRILIETLFEKGNLLQKLIYIQNNSNSGQAISRNIGFSNITGEYVHFIDQDDFIDEAFYSNFIYQTEDILLGSPHLFFNPKQVEINYIKNAYKKKLSKTTNVNDLWLLLISNFVVSPGQYLIRNTIFELVGGFPHLNIRGSDDYGLLFNLAAHNASLKYIDEAFFNYRIHELQNRINSKLEKSVIEFFNQPIELHLSCHLKLVRYIRCRILLWKVLSKIIFSYYFKSFKSSL